MTNEDFDKFLESIGGLENGFYADRPRIMSHGICSCGNGWYGIIKRLIEDLIELGWDKQICQIKEKFGGLRFYINAGNDKIYERIGEAENLSYKTCEETGLPGELRTDIGWYRTLSDEEYQKIKEKRNGT